MKKQSIIILIVVALVALLFSAGPVAGEAVKIEFSGEMCRAGMVDPGKTWTSPGGIKHIRDMQTSWNVFSEALVDGNMRRVMNVNCHVPSRIGPFWGTFSLVLTDYPLSSWEGTYTGYRYEDGLMYSRWVGHGTGDLEGLKIKFYVTKPPGVNPGCPKWIPLTGYILSPHGEFPE